MDVTDWNNDEIMRLLMTKGHITQKIFVEKIKDVFGENIPLLSLLS